MIGIGLLGRQFEAEESDDGRTGVGQVVEGVCRDGDGAGEGAGGKLAGEQGHVQENAHRAAENAVAFPQGRLRLLIRF